MNAKKMNCKATTSKNNPCKASPTPGSNYCFFHDPSKTDKRREAQSAGGKKGLIKTLPEEIAQVKINSCKDIIGLIEETINQVRTGEIDPKVANSVGYLANIGIKAIQQGDLEDRIFQLEAAINNRPLTENPL